MIVIALLMLVCLINLITCHRGKMSQWGQRTACIYLTSSFCIKGSFLALHNIGIDALIYKNDVYAIIISIIITVITLWICGHPKTNQLYQNLINKIGNIIVRES